MPASRLFVALCVMLLGLCAALPFRQTPLTHEEPPPATAPLALPLRRQDGPLELALPHESSPASGLRGTATPPIEPLVPATMAMQGERLQVAPPPAMPIAFRPITDELRPTSWKPAPPVNPQPLAKPRKYLLRDGDSLERLAERFLGDASRAEEIFSMNRHVLTRADLLPVGAEIMLPPRVNMSDAAIISSDR